MGLNVQQSRIEISAVDKTKDAFDSVKRGFDGIASQYLGLTTILSSGGFAVMIKQTIDAADAIHDLSTRTGISVEQLGAWALATEQSGTSMDALAKALGKASKYMVEHSSNLKAIGITGKTAEEVMLQLAGVISKLPSDDPRRVALAMEVLGKSAGELVPLLSEGEAGLRKMLERGRELNPVTSELASNADNFKDNLAELKLISSGLFVNLVANTLPSLNTYLHDMKAIIESGDWVDKLLFFTVGYVPGKVADKTHDPVEQIKAYEDAITKLKAKMDLFPNSGTLQSGYKPQLEQLEAGLAAQRARLAAQTGSPAPAVGDAEKARLQKQIDDLLNKDTKVSDYTKLTQAINEKIAASQRELALGQPLSDSEKLLSKLYADRASGAIDITNKERSLLEVSIKRLGVLDKQNDQEKEVQKAMVASSDEYDKQLDAIQKNVDQTQVQVETYGKSASAVTDVTIARLEAKKALLDEIGVYGEAIDRVNGLIDANNKLSQSQRDLESKDILANYAKGRETYFEGLDSEILKLKEQNELYGLTETQIAAVNVQRAEETKLKYEAAGGADPAYLYDLQHEIDLRKQMLEQVNSLEQKNEWKDIFSSIDKTAHDTFVSIFDSGKSAFDRLRDTLKNGLLDLLYQMTIKKWIFQISAAVTGTGVADSALADTVTGSSSGTSSLFSNGSSLLSIGKTIFTGFENAAVSSGAFLGNVVGSLGGSTGAMQAAFSIGQAIPYVAAAFAAVSVISSLFGGHVSRPKYYADTSVSNDKAFNIAAYGNSDAHGANVAIAPGISFGKSVETIAESFGSQISKTFILGTKYNQKYNTFDFNVGRSITKEGQDIQGVNASNKQALTNASALIFIQAVKRGFVDLDPYLEKIIDRSKISIANASTAVNALATFQNMYKALQSLPPIFKSISDAISNTITTDTAAALQARFNAINTYVGLFYTDTEKLSYTSDALHKQLAALKVAFPETRDGFRSLVDGIDTTTASGLSLFNTLVDLAPSMDTYYKALQQQADVTGQAADAAKKLADALSTDGFSSLVDYTRAQKYIQNGIPGFASGGDFAGGLRIVGENGPELEATGAARITSTSQLLDSLRNPQIGSNAMVSEIRALRAEIAQLRTEQLAAGIAVATNTGDMAKRIRKFDGDGMPPTRTTA